MTAIDFSSFVDQLAGVSGETILPFFRTALAVDNKKARGFDPVTAADRAAEQAMRALIVKNFPSHGIIGEEYGAERTDAEYVWVLDPIDGTKSFITGMVAWGTLIGLMRLRRAGVRHDEPAVHAREIFRRRRRGALSGTGGQPRSARARVRVARRRDNVHHQPAADERIRPRRFRPGGKRGQALALRRRLLRLLHAGGRADRSRDRDRDQAPRHRARSFPIVTGAGGIVTTWDNGPAQAGGRIVVAGDARVHKAALEMLKA